MVQVFSFKKTEDLETEEVRKEGAFFLRTGIYDPSAQRLCASARVVHFR